MPIRPSQLMVLIVALWCLAGAVVAQQAPLVPEGVTLDEVARRAIQAQWLTDEERSERRVFHGVWDDRDLQTPQARAMVALNAWRFDDPALLDPAVTAELRAEAMLLRGNAGAAIVLLESSDSPTAHRIRAQALETLGRSPDSVAATDALVARMRHETIDDPATIVEGVRSMALRGRIEGKPGRDYQTMMDELGRAHQQLDRLYWPAKLAEARLLMDKDNEAQAILALHETLALNPRCAEAWYLLGRAALSRFDFDSAGLAAAALQRLNREHPLASLLLAESRLTQDDPDGAMELLVPLVARWPDLRQANALIAAAQALYYDEAALAAALDRYEKLSPGSAVAYHVVGRQLAFNRQYEAAAEMLQEAIRRAPAWPAPRIELGLMELQSGRDSHALEALRGVSDLDPFNKRAVNSLFLLEELADYEQIESEHFIVRYRPGVDQVMADMMLEPLERIHALVSERFGWEPEHKTVIELLPDHQRFAVRITGMPFIHTVAACTGPVIALEVPREGSPHEHLGLFDWPRVIQHEYTHTITLGQTRNRIPHWLTEAAAVSMENVPRTYQTCLMLAGAYRDGTLFDLDEIKWAFIRPKQPGDRGKAYAQGHWMVQFMNQRFGESALVRLLERYFQGEREREAMPQALGVSREQFFDEFVAWAGDQVQMWGLAPEPSFEELADVLRESDPKLAAMMATSRQARLDAIARMLTRQIGTPASAGRSALTGNRWPDLMRPKVEVTNEILAEWDEAYPDHPDIAELRVRRQLGELDSIDETLVPMLEHYAQLRPVDPMPHKKLAQIYLQSDDPTRATQHLEALALLEDKTPVYLLELARLYRQQGQLDRALEKATAALYIDPYDAPTRERAAALAIQAGQLEVARQHIVALTLIEPSRSQHQKRLEAIDALLD
jgi:tetratricopeptide (TPR) repeat protein